MRNLKRVLSLALALVMVLGMMVITTSAAKMTDADEITYTEAVDVVSAIGVITGYPDGSFQPKGNLTREQGAALICYLLMGKDKADKLTGTGLFTDVAADRWSAGEIEYCVNLGYIAGRGDGTFDPEGELTGIAYGKLLLCALGYDAKVEGYEGDNWAAAILSDMIDVGLDVKGLDMGAVLTREVAAQMTFQALTKTMVKYATKGTSVTVNGIDIVTGASTAEAVVNNESSYKLSDTVDENFTGTMQFCEKYFSGLKLTDGNTDAFNRPATVWQYTTIGAPAKTVVAADKADYVMNGEVKLGVLYKKLGAELVSKLTDGKCTVYVNGNDTPETEKVAPAKDDMRNALAGTGNGTVAEIFVNNTYGSEAVTIVVTQTFIDTVKKVTPADDAGNKRFVTLMDGKTFTTEDFAEKDVVLYTKTVQGGDTIQSMAKAELVSGKLEKIVTTNGTPAYTVDGVEYVKGQHGDTGITTAKLDKTVSFYVDAQNNIMMDKGAAPTATNYIFVLGNAAEVDSTDYLGNASGHTAEIYGVLADGTVVTKTADVANDLQANAMKNKLYNYTVSPRTGNLVLTEEDTDAYGSEIAVKATSVGTDVLNSDTVFVFIETQSSTNNTAKNVTVMVGNANIGTAIEANTAYVGADKGVAEIVYVVRAYDDGTSDSGDLVYISGPSSTVNGTIEQTSVNGLTKTVYKYNGVTAAGEKITLTHTADTVAKGVYKYNKDLTLGDAQDTTSEAITAINGSTVAVNGIGYNQTDATKVVFTGDETELTVGQTVYYVKGATPANNKDYVAIFVAQDTIQTATTADLKAAIEDAGAYDTIYLAADFTLTEKLTITSDVTIAAEVPMTITTNVVDAFEVTGGTLTLGKNVTITSNTSVLYANGGNIVIDGAEISVVDPNYVIAYVDNGTIEVKSGSIAGSGANKPTMEAKGSSAAIVISGGTVSSADSNAVYVSNGASLTISGGVVKTTCITEGDVEFYAVTAFDTATVNVTGGTVSAAAQYALDNHDDHGGVYTVSEDATIVDFAAAE